jgi:large repetitive protein
MSNRYKILAANRQDARDGVSRVSARPGLALRLTRGRQTPPRRRTALRLLTAGVLFSVSTQVLAALGAAVTLVSGDPTNIYPGQSTRLEITLSNSNTSAAISSLGFSNSLPGTLPNGLKTAGASTYTCTDPATATTSPGSGTLTASVGTQAISLSGGTIPARANNTDGTCTIRIPVTAGTSSGSATAYTYTLTSGAVTGTDNSGAVANSGTVSQSINVLALQRPAISKSFSNSTLILGGVARTLSITLTNPNSVDIANFGVTDNFPTAGAGGAIIEVAGTPSATSSCTGGGTAPGFTPAAGDTSLSATGGTLAASSSCTLTVQVQARQTNGVYSTTQTNTINASSQFSNDIGIPAAANATASVIARSPLQIGKTVNAGSLATGQNGFFTITLTNNGSNPLTLSSFTDQPIDGVGAAAYGLTVNSASTTCSGGSVTLIDPGSVGRDTGITLTGGSIPASGNCSVTVNFTGTVQTANTPRSYTNSLAAGAVDVGNVNIVSQSASAAVTVYENINVTKAAPSPTNAVPGNPVRYQVTVQNWSTAAINNIDINESLASAQTFLTGTIGANDYTPSLSGTGCSGLSVAGATGATGPVFTIGTLPARSSATSPGSCTLTFWAMTSTSAAGGSTYTNQLAANSVCYNPGGGPICNGGASNSVSGTITANALSVTKAFSPAGPLSEGAITRMTLTLSNLSANSLTSTAISDTLPAAVSGGQMRVANPANAATTCGSATITAVPNSTSVSLNSGTLPARAGGGTGVAGSCVLQVDVTAAAGNYTNSATATAIETYANGSTHALNASASASITFNSALSATKTFSPAAMSAGGKSTVTVRLNNTGALALTGLGVTDPLPSGMLLANPANAYTTCAGSTTLTATPGANSASLSGASIAGGGNCDFIFDVIVSGSASWVNSIPIGNITADGGVFNQSAVAGTLNYQAPTSLIVAKATNPSTLTFPGQVSQLTITITNGSQAVTGLSLTDYFTQDGTSGAAANGMVIAPTTAAGTTCPGGSVSAAPSGSLVGVDGIALAASQSCTITVNVSSSAVGGITNYIPASAIRTNQGLTNGSQATTSLTTQTNLGVTKQFTPNVITPGTRSRLRITVLNSTPQPAASIAFTDTLPAGVSVPAGPGPVTTCTGATVSVPASDQVQLSGGNLPAASGSIAATCYLEIDVAAAAQGDYVNTITTGSVTATIGGAPASNSQPTSDTLRVKFPVIVHKAIDGLTLDAGNPSGYTTGTASHTPGAPAPLTIRLDNANAAALTQAALTDTLPGGLVVATLPGASTTCTGGSVTAAASATTIRLTGATIPAAGFCTLTVNVLSNISGTYTNTISAASVTTFEGVSNDEASSARILISTPPTVSKQFSPVVIAPNAISTLTLVLGNDNSSAYTLSALFTDTLPTAPGAVVVATPPSVVKTCPGAVTAVAGSGSISYASGASVPAGGCSIQVNVTAATPGVFTNNIPAGALQTSAGNNQQPANATLTVSTLGYVSGRVFADNNVTPNGSYDTGIDTPLAGVTLELRSGANCSGTVVSVSGLTNPATTDVLGNYSFAGLPAGTYSVCQPVPPGGTSNGTSTAGGITSINGSTGTPGTAANPTASTSQITGIVLNGNGAGGEISGTAGNNFAEIYPSVLSGTVFLDQNNNGLQNGSDIGIAGVTIELLNAGNSVIATTTTNASGNYSFAGLVPGTYMLREPNQPTNSANGITVAGSVGNGGSAGTASGVTTLPSMIAGIVLPPNTTSSANNFAELSSSRTLAGRVFLDYNGDGSLNGSDYGIGSQTIDLTGSDINGNAVSASTTSASDGSYLYTGLPAGSYAVVQPNQPTGTTNGTATAGSTGGTASNPSATSSQIIGISLTGSNSVSANNNFAEVPGPAADLTLSKTHAPASFGEGSSNGYFTLTPGNIGTLATSGAITVIDTLPVGLTPSSAGGTAWTCGIASQTVTCTSGTVIGAGATGNTIAIRVTVGSGLAGQILINNAVISGGNEPPGFDGNNTASDAVTLSASARLAGHVWRDVNHDRVRDVGEAGIGNWGIELLLSGQVVASTTTDSTGTYVFSALSPGSGYQLRFRHPDTGQVWGVARTNEQGIAPMNGTRDSGPATPNTAGSNSGNPAGATINGDGMLSGLALLAGDNIVEQSLPLDPAGVVYDSVTRNPVAAAVVTLSGPGGFNAATHLVGANASVTTGTSGDYQFLLTPSAPSGTYTLALTTYPGGYLPQPSILIPVCTNSLSVSALPDPALIQSINSAPLAAAPAHNPAACPVSSAAISAGDQASTQFYLSFGITSGTSANVVNNHIPIDPVLGGAIVLTKTTPMVNVSVGQLVPYTITARNMLTATLSNIDLRDTLPAGFKYKAGSASLDGVASEPNVNGRVLTWANLVLNAGATRTLKLILVVGTGVQPGEYVNSAQALNNLVPPPTSNAVSNVATATVRVIPDPLFECSDLIGKVFDDRNANGYQDEAEPGLPNVRVVTARGWLVTTDAEGRFHIACPVIPDAERGSNFVMKLDERTLPTGYRLTTENPRAVRLTQGKLGKINFGAKIHKVVRLDLSDAAFDAGSIRLKPDWQKQLDTLPQKLHARPTVLRLGYKAGNEDATLARRRLHAIGQTLKDRWQHQACCHTLQIEEELFLPAKSTGKGAAP